MYDGFGKHLFCEAVDHPIAYKLPTFQEEERFIMTNCYHNSFAGLMNRYLKDDDSPPLYDQSLVERILDEFVTLLRPHLGEFPTLSEFLSEKKGKLGNRYRKACKDVLEFGYDPYKHSRIGAFIKNELYSEDKTPRMIMGRDPRFNLLYGCFTSWLEHAMVKLPEFAKGKNFDERGEQFIDLFGDVSVFDILEGDFSKYESTQKARLLMQVEIGIFRRLLTEMLALFEKIFWTKMHKHGYTAHGLLFYFMFCRGSGDMDTGLFNSILSWVACRYFEIVNKTYTRKFEVDGDDNGIAWPKERPSDWIDTFKLLGFDSKIIRRKNRYEYNFCSGKFLEVDRCGNIKYIQDVRKLLMNNSIVRVRGMLKDKLGAYYYALGVMYQRLYHGSKLFFAYGEFLKRPYEKLYGGKYVNVDLVFQKLVSQDIYKVFNELQGDTMVREIDDDIFSCEMSLAFDMPFKEQYDLIEYFNSTLIDIPVELNRPFKNRSTPSTNLWVMEKLDLVYDICVGGYNMYTVDQIIGWHDNIRKVEWLLSK